MNCDVNFEPNGQALFKTFHNSLSLNYKHKIKLPRPLRKRFGLGCSLQVIMPYHGTFINDCFTIAFSGAITRQFHQTQLFLQLLLSRSRNYNCTMKRFCTCGLRRTTMDMAGKHDKKSSNTKSSSTAARSNPEGTICKQVTSTGPCQTTALTNTALCINHTCKEPACKLSKSAKVSYCKKHTATNTPASPTTTLSTEYLDVAGSNV